MRTFTASTTKHVVTFIVHSKTGGIYIFVENVCVARKVWNM